MLIDISNQDKKLIGLFIDFRRKQYKRKDNNFLIENFIKDICSKQTYNKISKGIEVKESQLYDNFLTKLHYTYLYDDIKKSEISKKEEKLLSLLEKEDKTLFYKQLDTFIKKFMPFQVFALESVLLESFMILRNKNLNDQDIDILLQLYPILDDIAKEICGYFLLQHVYHYQADKYHYSLLEDMGLIKLKTISNRWWILNLLIRWELYYLASVDCENLLKLCKIEKNRRMEHRIKITRLFIIMAIESNSFEKYADEIESYTFCKPELDCFDTYQFMHVVGLYHYCKKDYDKAWKYLSKSVYYEKGYFPEIIFLNHIATVQGNKLPNDLIKKETVSAVEKEYQVLYQYFCMKHNGFNIQALEDYLWQHCRWLVKETYPSWIMKDIIHSELDWISQQTGNRKRLYQFNKWND